MDVSVLIPALNEADNLKVLIGQIRLNLDRLTSDYEVIVLDGGSTDDTADVVRRLGAKLIIQSGQGFGRALRDGFKVAQGNFIITMDADLSHPPEFIQGMWEERFDAELIIASRYVPGGRAQMGAFRYILSRILNYTFSFLLSLDLKDLSSNFRMYRKSALDSVQTEGNNFDILPEILLKVYGKGWKIIEVPFYYQPRQHGGSHIRLARFGIDYLKTLWKMWQLRNSIYCADYDFRAFYSKIFLQRYWQRKRYDIILKFVGAKRDFLDIGCGSSKIIIDNPKAIALDISLAKLRYLRARNKELVNASVGSLPFKDASFDCVVCSEVIEHTAERNVIAEIYRVLNKNGLLVVGTPDYDKRTWRIIERLYAIFHHGGYADEHISHYTFKGLKNILEETGFRLLDYAYILNSELIIKAQKI